MNSRKAWRAAALQALQASPRLYTLTTISAWTGNIPAKMLPVFGVVTPQERATPSTHSSMERSTLLQVVIKRLGGDELEDTLDEDADAVEAAICAAIGGRGVQCLPEDITVALNGDGEQRVGTLISTFRVTTWRPVETEA